MRIDHKDIRVSEERRVGDHLQVIKHAVLSLQKEGASLLTSFVGDEGVKNS